MRTLTHFAEPYSPTGNVTADGVLNQLGRPKLDMLAVLVRESVQNSWDAKRQDTPAVRYGISGWTLDAQQRDFLANQVLVENTYPADLANVLSQQNSIRVLAIYDRGTEGLSGPTRADHPPMEGESNNFVDFLRNVGQPPDKQLAGGTYGYGKAIFYRVSDARTILVHSRCNVPQVGLESRFMGAALGTPFSEGDTRFTGRHWWGEFREDVVEPIIGIEADRLARHLGMPLIPENERGTTILILQPHFGEKTPEDSLMMMAQYLLWYFWPKMLENEAGTTPMQFEVSWEGKKLRIPHPSKFSPLEGFVAAMRRLKTKQPAQQIDLGATYSIQSERPRKRLGELALERFPAQKRARLIAQEDSPIPSRSHHVALMRQPELVVRYLEGPELPSDHIEYAGVFITDSEVDHVFADAEPPTHDDWISDYLDERRERTFVNVALREIKACLNDFVRPPMTQTTPGELISTAAFANQLGDLLPGQSGASTFADLFSRRRSIRRSVIVSSSPETTASDQIKVSDTRRAVEEQTIWQTDQSSEHFSRAVGGEALRTPQESNDMPHAQSILIDSTGPAPIYIANDQDEPGPEVQIPTNNFRSINDRNPSSNPDGNKSTTITKPATSVSSKVRIRDLSAGALMLINGEPALRFEFQLQFSGDPSKALVNALVGAQLDGGDIEVDPPEGSAVPRVLFWEHISGEHISQSSSILIPSELSGLWSIVVSIPEDMMVGIDLSASIWSQGGIL